MAGTASAQGSAQWASTAPLDRSSSTASFSGWEPGRAGLWGFGWVSFKANLILCIKIVFLLKNVKNGPGRSE